MSGHFRRFACVLLSLGSLLAALAHAEDKSATREGLVKLPGSGGTVQKDESSFDFSISRGTASYSIPLPDLPGRGGMKPSLALIYNQGAGDGGAGMGIGWALSSSAISFNDDLGGALHQKRLDTGDFSSHLALDGQRLIPHGTNQAGQNFEYSLENSSSFAKIIYTKQSQNVSYLGKNSEKLFYTFPGGFIVTSAQGQKAYYAEDSASAELDPEHPERVVRWPLTLEINAQKEAIFYRYVKSGNRSYLSEVDFAAGQSRYQFELIKTRSSLISHKAAFSQANNLLLGGITASFRGELQAQLCLAYLGRDLLSDAFTVRSGQACATQAGVDLAPLVLATNKRSLNVLDQLRTVYRFGKGELIKEDNTLPKISFDYSNWNEAENQRNIVFPAQSLVQTNASSQFELFDYNLDALVDLIQENDQSLKISLGTDNLDSSFSQSVAWTVEKDGVAVKPHLGSPAWHFVEMNGDSYTDLVEVGQGKVFVYLRQNNGSFAAAESLEIPWINPSLFASQSLRWVDLNNDGLTDLLGTEIENGQLHWKLAINQTMRTAEGLDYYFLETRQNLPYKAALSNILADESLILTDINGDQLLDFIRIRPDRSGLCIYENQGNVYAESSALLFGKNQADVLSASNCENGRFVQVEGLSGNIQSASRRIWFLDANGDGILDLTSFSSDDSEMRVWLGFGNGDFLQSALHFSTLDLQGKPQISVQAGRDKTRVADIDGDGQAELVIFQAGIPGLKPVVVIDFNRLAQTQLVKSNLLTTIENATGLRYDLRYASSTDELLRDRKQGLLSKSLHFPMYVVKQLVTSEADPLHPGSYKQGREVKEMLYHQPVYDPLAKKLVGFQSVETILYGDEFKGENERTQLSSYRREVFESDYRLAGRTKELFVHEYLPTGTFEAESEISNSLSLNDATIHSMKNYTQDQESAAPGRMLASSRYRWSLVVKEDGYDNEQAFFVRQLGEESWVYGTANERAHTQKSFSEFDAYNFAHIVDDGRDAIAGPDNLSIPARQTRQIIDFDEARAQLKDVEIVSAPSLVQSFVVSGMQQNLIAESSYVYSPLGQVLKSKQRALHQSTQLLSGLMTPTDRTSERSYDMFGNAISSSMNGVLLETVRYDATGTFPIEQRNAIGQATQLFYGADSMDSCANLSGQDVQEGMLKGFKDIRGNCHYFSYDKFGRRTLYQRDDGYQERYQYKFAEAGLPSRILKFSRRYEQGKARPAGELEWVSSLEAWTPAGARIATLEVLEEGQGVRVVSYEEQNRKKNIIRVYTPYKDLNTNLAQVFETGIIPTAGKDAFTLTSYDALDRPIQRIYPTGRMERHQFEPWGQIQYSSYASAPGQDRITVKKTLLQLGKQVFAIIDEVGGTYRYIYDIYDNVAEVWLPSQNQPRRYVYNSLDQKLQQCVPEVGCSTFEYDVLGQLSIRSNYDSTGRKTSALKYFYDVLGRLQELYDNNRLSSKNQYDLYPAEYRSSAQGSAAGLQTMSKSFDEHKLYDDTKLMFYDRSGRLVERRTIMGSDQPRSFTEKFRYTLDGALQEAEDPFGVKSFYRLSPTLRFTHLEMELPWQRDKKEVIVDKVSYNAKGQVETVAYRQGSYTNLAYDPQTLLLTQIQSSFKKADGNQEYLQYASLDFDGNGSVVSIEDRVPAQTSYGQVNRSAKFAYNKRDELVQFERYSEVQSFAYDLAGNFTKNTELGGELTTSPEHSLLPRGSSETTYVFDASGQLKSRNSKTPVRNENPWQDLQKRRQIRETRFNGLGQLIYLKTEQQEIFFGYDADGQRNYKRLKDINGSGVTDSLFPSKTVIVEGTGAQSFVFIGDRRIARIEHATDLTSQGHWYYYLLDHLGSTDFTMEANGTPVEQMIYRAYGTEPDINALSQGVVWNKHQKAHQSLMPKERTHHRFTSQYLDDDSGLYYYGSRYYDPLLGRFISADDTFLDDPEMCIDRPLECNAYSYAANNPVKYTDPSGKWAHIAIGAIVGAVIGGGADAIFNPNSNWKTVAAAAAGGALTGGLAAATGGASLAAQSTASAIAIGAGVGAASAGAGNAVTQGINIASGQQQSFSGKQLGTSMAVGGVLGGAGAAVSRGLSGVASKLVKSPCGCFAPGTQVLTKDGLKAIELIKVGDIVLARDEASGQVAPKAVKTVFHYQNRPYFELSYVDVVGDLGKLIVTDDHPFYVANKGWVKSIELKAGDQLILAGGGHATVKNLLSLGVLGDTHNLEVEDFHTYFVGKQGIFVHNSSPCATGIGYAAGAGKSAFTPNRLQHASHHLVKDGILPNWSKATGQKFTEMGTKILESPMKTFDHVLKGNAPVKGFYGVVDGKDVVIMVYKGGANQGEVATAIQPSLQQMKNWGIK